MLPPEAEQRAWLQATVPGDTLGVVASAVRISGTQALLVLDDGSTVMGFKNFGKGRVVAFGAADLFSNQRFGSTSTVPSPRLRAVFQVEYDLFESIANINVTERYGPTQ